ncbi:hypothetical protein A2316_01755 [Candidatus Falkowbacteria bacterium RIFOXYB2_FULL_38_15]|uniref:CBM-cenC domain-containing protein n=1 Tax=Candidatus Falkowbacteria bacterium RIFOXYA2_FULL_38_12 TaxID=1797993 RepID=A0A1F5S2M0_9BACT|nr:MAG: hypothetical protein A2257_03535 [Candidatus Falkowbacteria bacterium RIFOXYA2_FULL_38_12]OGF32677.1 MAG: hypothetical protein A2316_01755 [Candidatus Falkowbacteria bacterium RIFOXYB2_FULL_38_15]
MLFNFPSKLKKHAHILILGLFIFTQVFSGLFLYVKSAEAQGLPTSNAILDSASVKETIDRAAAKRLEELQGSWWMGLISAVTNAVGYFANKIAYDAAVAVASLGSGQTPAFFTQDWGSYLSETGLNSAGEFIGSLGEAYGDELEGSGLGNLCMPPDPQFRLNIGLSLAGSVAPNGPQPRCEWSNIVDQWDTFITEASTPEVLSRVSLQFSPGSGSGLGAWVQAHGTMQEGMRDSEKKATKEREEGQGFKSVGELITKRIKTPSGVIKDSITKQIDPKSATEADIESAGSKSSSAGALIGYNALGMLGGIASNFVNTLASKLMDRVMHGLSSIKDIGKLFPKGGSGLDNPEFAGLGGRAVAEATFADFLAPKIQETGKYDPLVEMMTCPSGVNKSPENCVLDGQFAQAITQATMGDPITVAEAIKDGLLKGTWPLISSGDTRHNDQYCFQKGYCYSNLVKLRKYRIIPVGWEMAANLATGDRTGTTLETVVKGFNTCNSKGIADNDHPWCHLIDPNWVIKVPAHQCRARVYGAISIEGTRAETCVDAPSCIAEDGDGNCEGGWGYCTREKNVWRLPGDPCDSQFESCRALRTRSGEVESYLISTVDYGPPCSADDVGCKWYSTYQEKVGDEYKWQDRPNGADPEEKTDRIYFNKNVAQCNEEGCSEFYKTDQATNLNLIANSSFEEAENIDDDEKEAKYWRGSNDRFSSVAKDGGSSLQFDGGVRTITQDVSVGKPLSGRNFVLSLYARNFEAGDCNGTATIGPLGAGAIFKNVAIGSSSSWKRYKTESHYFANNPSENLRVIITGNNCLIDAVQLEEASSATNYHSGWAGLGDGLNLKKAPEYYNCYNYNNDGTVKTNDDAPQCSGFIGACQENEAGCEMYSPRDGDPAIPGITNFPNDYCPQECVGYQTFKQLKTNFEQDKYPLFFIPKTAEKCSASEDGCDEFTSLETEAVENYSSLRQCQKPGDDSAVYYTWEGSDTTGYQLKTWNLKESGEPAGVSNADPESGIAPCVSFAPGVGPDGRRACAPLPILAVGTPGVCVKNNTIVGSIDYNPDCREFYDALGKRHYRLYSKTIVSADDCHEYRKTYSNEADCSSSGGLWNVVNNDCKYDVYPAESKRCKSVGCRAYRGNAGANVRNVFQNNFETGAEEWTGPAAQVSQSSEAVDNGGHSLKIESRAVAEKSVAGGIKKDGIYLISFWAKTEAARGQASFQFNDGAIAPALRPVPAISEDLSLSWQQYTIGPIEITWEPTPDNLATGDVVEGDRLQVTANNATIYLDNILFKEVIDRIYLVKDSWNTPATCDQTAFGGYLPQAMLGCEEYRDRDNRQHFLKSFTSLCREEAIGCQKLVDTKNSQSPYGEFYNGVCVISDVAVDRDRDGDVDDHDICIDAAGCGCSVNGARVCIVPRGENSCRYNSVGIIPAPANRVADTVEIKADSYSFLVVDKSKTCNPSNIGCEAFGAPKLDSMGSIICTLAANCGEEAGCECKRDGAKMCTVEDGKRSCTGDFDAVNFLNNPKFYEGQSKILCEASYDTCEEYLGSDGAKFYFRDPGKRTCDWKESVTYGGEKRSGWFRKDDNGTDVPCYPDYTMAGTFGIWKNADPDYEGRVGNCPADQNLCTKFVDPTATSGENPDGEPYFYLNNDKLEKQKGECNGEVSLQQGCILFDDTSNLNKLYNANSTYLISEKGSSSIEPGGKVAPVDCTKGECKTCGPEQIVGRAPPVCDIDDPNAYCNTDHYCVSNGDCSWDDPWPLTCQSDEHLKNNTNVIFKVKKDRVCGEWLACKTSTTTWDSFSNKKREICDGIGLCNKVAEGNQAVTCGQWIDDSPENKTAEFLDLEKYTSRNTGWEGSDYSGYSIPNQFPAYKLSQVNIADEKTSNAISAESEWRLGLIEEKYCYGFPPPAGDPLSRNPVRSRLCGFPGRGPVNEEKGTCYAENGVKCSTNQVEEGKSIIREGKCWNKKCIYDPEGKPIDGFPKFAEYKPLEAESVYSPMCRAYPEKNSPFPRAVAYNEDDESAIKQGFGNAQVCEEQFVCEGGDTSGEFCFSEEDDCGEEGTCKKIDNPCDCSYTKLTYHGTTKYIHKDNDKMPENICVGGSKAGQSCKPEDCPSTEESPESCACGSFGKSNTGSCTGKDKVETVLGLEGYCLEKDKTTYINGSPEENACLTWLPIDHLSGSVDVYNQFVKAGYAPGDSGQMCIEAELFVRPTPIWGCVQATGVNGYRSDGACEYETIYDGSGAYDVDDVYCQWENSRNAGEGGCISGNITPATCTSCPTGWTYIETGCSPTNDENYCGANGFGLDQCIYYCIPPGPLLNNLGDDDPNTEEKPIIPGEASVCFPDFITEADRRSERRGGYFEVKNEANTFEIGTSGNSRKSPALYCEADYYMKYSDYREIIEGTDGILIRYKGTGYGRESWHNLKKVAPTFVPVCNRLVEASESKNSSKAWTDRLYKDSKKESCDDINDDGEGTCIKGTLRSGLPCSQNSDCEKIRSNVLRSGDFPSLEYTYDSSLSPFGYRHKDLNKPAGIPFCSDEEIGKMELPSADNLGCSPGMSLYGERDGHSASARPYLNFSYQIRRSCDDDADCSSEVIRCDMECRQKCGEGLPVCPPETECSPEDHESIPTMGDLMTRAEKALCPDVVDDKIRYCVPVDDSEPVIGRGLLRFGTSGDPTCTSECERAENDGIAVGTCSNVERNCLRKEDCYTSLCAWEGRRSDDPIVQRWQDNTRREWDEWSGGEGGFCNGLDAEVDDLPDDEGGKYDLGKTRIAELFAKTFKIYEWEPKNTAIERETDIDNTDFGAYVLIDSEIGIPLEEDTFSTWDITESGDPITREAPTPPHVAPIKLPCINNKCSPMQEVGEYVSGFTVNDKNSGTIISRSGELAASIKFFAWADKNQMPIKKVCVDFGNGDDSPDCDGGSPINFYKNHWGYDSSGASACDGSDFGHAKQACTEEPFSYNVVYTCPSDAEDSMDPCPEGDPTATNCYTPSCDSITGGCCIFRPKVHVLDNWGWCTGECDGRSQGGCYGTGGIAGECDINQNYPHWTTSGVKVIVAPR